MTQTYKIKKGDTLSSISRNLGISVKDLAKANKIEDVNKIQTGASLTIPSKPSSVERVKPLPQTKTGVAAGSAGSFTKDGSRFNQYTIKKGDNLYDIAKANLLNVDQLMEANKNIKNPNKIKIGQKINVPQFNVQGQREFDERINLPVGTPTESFFPSNVRQLGYDLFRRQSPNVVQMFQGEDADFTEANLTPDEYRALQEIVRKKLKSGSTVLSYKDYGTGEGDVGDVDFFGLKDIYNKFNDPAYALKTLIGNANIEINERGEVVITDRYNFNEADPESLGDYAAKAALVASNPGYQTFRQAGSVFGSNEGEGSRIRLNLGKINLGNTEQYAKNINIQDDIDRLTKKT